MMEVKFVSEKLKNVLSGIDRRKEQQSKRKKSLNYKGRAKELGELRIAINIAQREVPLPVRFLSLPFSPKGQSEVQTVQQLPPSQKKKG